mmetsp:Transcript_25349/g.39792  ORF Transcript_25349/g.39792 Transcript_25349/m.39792 type:complete len:226 (+) Transcript_25349:226-903(+)
MSCSSIRFDCQSQYLVSRKWSIDVELIKEDERLSIELFMNHHTKDTHLCGTSVVQLPCPQIDHILLTSCIWSKSNRPWRRTEISWEGSLLLLPRNFKESGGEENRNQELGSTEDSLVSSNGILASREASARPGSGKSPGSKHSNTSMLQFNSTKTVETFLVTIGHETEGIPASKFGGCSSNFAVESGVEGGRCLSGLGGGKGGSAGDEGGKDSGLHGGFVGVWIL